jgi:hypothetical protein
VTFREGVGAAWGRFVDKGIIHTCIILKTWWNRGITYVTIFLTLFNLVSLSLLWRPILVTFGIPSWLFYVIVPTVAITVTLIIGKYDTDKQIWLRESDVINQKANPYHEHFMKIFEEIPQTKRDVDDLQTKVDRILEKLGEPRGEPRRESRDENTPIHPACDIEPTRDPEFPDDEGDGPDASMLQDFPFSTECRCNRK